LVVIVQIEEAVTFLFQAENYNESGKPDLLPEKEVNVKTSAGFVKCSNITSGCFFQFDILNASNVSISGKC